MRSIAFVSRQLNVYADLACYTDAEERSEAWQIWRRGSIIRDRLLSSVRISSSRL